MHPGSKLAQCEEMGRQSMNRDILQCFSTSRSSAVRRGSHEHGQVCCLNCCRPSSIPFRYWAASDCISLKCCSCAVCSCITWPASLMTDIYSLRSIDSQHGAVSAVSAAPAEPCERCTRSSTKALQGSSNLWCPAASAQLRCSRRTVHRVEAHVLHPDRLLSSGEGSVSALPAVCLPKFAVAKEKLPGQPAYILR